MISINRAIELKGIAILLIIFGHIFYEIFLVPNYLPSVGVFIFLILSGYGIMSSFLKKGPINFFKRLLNILIPYWIFSVLKIIFSVFYLQETFSISEILSIFVGLDVFRILDPTMWFIAYIIFWYIMMYLIYYRVSSNRVKIMLLGLCLLSMVFINYPNWTFYMLGFPLGVWIKENEKWTYLILYKISFIYFVYGIFILGPILFISGARLILMSISFVIGILLIGTIIKLKLNSVFFYHFGSISFSLYLIEGYPIYSTELVANFKDKTLFLVVYLTSIWTISILFKILSNRIIKINIKGKNLNS